MESRPEVVEEVERQLKVLNQFVHIEKDYPFVECATFADYIKNTGMNWQFNWHFVDTPIFADGFNTTTDPQL